MPRQSAFRGPEARTFALLHRSQRDPLINDPEASDRVLSERPKGKGKARAVDDLTYGLGDVQLRDNEGEAAEYGVLYDDTEYDYMQHLRSTNGGVDAVFVEAPKRRQQKRADAALFPAEALPPNEVDERDYSELVGIPERPFGLQPDMDPRLREALEALEDDAFVDEGFMEEGQQGDGFFDAIVGGGDDDGAEWKDDDETEEVGAYELEVERFKSAKSRAPASDDGEDFDSEEGDTIAALRESAARRPPRPPASAMSGMSASSMFRSQGLQNLDDQFDQLEREYLEDEDEESSSLDEDEPDERDFTLFDPTTKRDDLDSMMDDFLSRYEIVGNKLRVSLEGATPQAKVDTIRRELLGQEGTISDQLGVDEKERIKRMADAIVRRQAKKVDKPDLVPDERYADRFNRWDCETVLSTYSNLENHPRLLSARGFVQKSESRIQLDPKTGVPTVIGAIDRPAKRTSASATPADETVQPRGPVRETVTRSKNETPEERKARKQQVRAERQERRTEKKATKTTFGDERKRQQRRTERDLATGAADVGHPANVSGANVMKLS